MKQGKNLVELAKELTRRSNEKKDFVAPTKQLMVSPALKMVVGDHEPIDISNHTHRQIGTWANIPAKYYDKMQGQAPQLLSDNVNHWFQTGDKSRMVRTLDGTARAFLSDRYRRIDNEDIAEQVLPVLLDSGNFAEVISTEVTEKKMYIKALFPRVNGEVSVGDEVQAGVVISNSEIGMGSLLIQFLIYRLWCANGAISADNSLSRYHVGKQVAGDGEQAYRLFHQETLQADDKALMMKIRDIVTAASRREVFDQIVQKMRDAKEGVQVARPVEAVEVLAETYTFNEGEKQSVLENLIKNQDYSRYGMLNAVTASANTHDNYDRATELESIGGKMLDLPQRDWKVIAEAA